MVREYEPERNVLGNIDDTPHKWGRTAASVPGVPGTGENTHLLQPHSILAAIPCTHPPMSTTCATTGLLLNPCLMNPYSSSPRAGERNVLSFLSPDSGYDR